MSDIHLSWKLLLFKERLFDAFKKEEAEHKAKSEDDSEEEPESYLTYANNLMLSLFSNCKVYLTTEWFIMLMDYIIIRLNYRMNSTLQQLVKKRYLLVMDTIL